MKYGYARVSTQSQDLAAQVERLEAAGCQKIFREKLSGKDANRPQLKRLLKALKPGDVVDAVVGDRVARDPLDLLLIVRTVTSAGAELHFVDEPFIDTTSEISEVVVFLWGWLAKMQRRSILHCTAGGRDRAMTKGVKFGRKPKLSEQQCLDALASLAAGETRRVVARRYNVSRSTISRLYLDRLRR